MIAPVDSPPSSPAGFATRLVLSARSRSVTYLALGAAILLLDFFTGPFLMFPILFVVPVTLAAWFCTARLAYLLAVLLPVGRLIIAVFVDHTAPTSYSAANALVRIAVLAYIGFLANRTARQTQALQQQIDTLVTICAWSRTVEYRGEWIWFETYLLRRFNVHVSHGISPAEAEKVLLTQRRSEP